MQLIKIIGIFQIAGMFLIACGPETRDVRTRRPFLPNEFNLNEPMEVRLDDSRCQSQNEIVDLTKTLIHRVDGFTVTSDLTNLKRTRTAASLENDFVKNTTYGREFVRKCDGPLYLQTRGTCIDPNTGSTAYWYMDDKKGGNLRVCKDEHEYSRTSFEGVSLATSYYIQNAAKRIKAMEHAPIIKPVLVETLPNFKTIFSDVKLDDGTITTQTQYLTHNAAYLQTGDEETGPIIAVFPEAKDDLEDVWSYLWESAFVLSHEFGHHVEASVYGSAFKKSGVKRDGISHQYLFPKTSLLDDSEMQSQTMGAFSEGFANLASYYINHGDVSSLTGIECVGTKRDPTKGEYGDGTVKSLNEDVISTLNSTSRFSSWARGSMKFGCEEPSYESIHDVGAIVSFAINESFRLISHWRLQTEDPQNSLVNEDLDYRLNHLLLMIKYLAADFENDAKSNFTTVNNNLNKVLTLMIKNALEENSQLSDSEALLRSNLCKHYEKHLPVLENQWTISEGNCG